MIVLATLLLARAASLGPPPALQVCLSQVQLDPCATSALQLEAAVHAWGLAGDAELAWSVDGAVRERITAPVAEGEPSRHLVIFEPSASTHLIALEARVGSVVGRDELRIGPAACPSALQVETVEVMPGRRVLVLVANRGPGASGSWGIRAEVAGSLVYESVVDSLAPGHTYELLLGWQEFIDRAGPGRALIPLVVRLNPGPADLLVDRPSYRVLLPRR